MSKIQSKLREDYGSKNTDSIAADLPPCSNLPYLVTIVRLFCLISTIAHLYMSITGPISVPTSPVHRQLQDAQQQPLPEKIRPPTNKEAFTNIYKDNIWDGSKKYPSGFGSIPQNNLRYLLALQHLVDCSNINRIVEVGFGDFNLFGQIRLDDIKTYIGYDVADAVKRKDSKNEFFKIISDIQELQNVTGDLLISKDVLHHWPNEYVEYFFDKIVPNFKYVFLTNDYSNYTKRPDINFSQYAPINPNLLTDRPYQEIYSQMYLVEKKGFIFPQRPC